jgi:hypothetical protein
MVSTRLGGRHIELPISGTLGSIHKCAIELLDDENVGVAVGTELLSF